MPQGGLLHGYSRSFWLLCCSFRSVVLSFCRSLVLSFCRSVVVSSSPPVRRLITCIDTLYEHNVKVIVSADAPITEVFQPYGEVGGDHQGRYEQAATEGQGDLLGKFLVMRWCFKFTKLVFPSDVLCFFLSFFLPPSPFRHKRIRANHKRRVFCV